MRYRLQQRLFADCETNLVDLPAGTIITVVRHVSLEQIEVSWEGGSGLIFTVDLKAHCSPTADSVKEPRLKRQAG